MSLHCVPSVANTTSVPAMRRVDSQELLIMQAVRFLDEHSWEPVTIQDLADHLFYSASHLTRTFTRVVGASPMRYLAARRFQKAKYLLAAEYLDVLETCHEVGYSSAGTFSRRFVADVGLAPGEFRRAADRVCETELAAVSLWIPQTVARVRVRLDIPPEMRPWAGGGALPVDRNFRHAGAVRTSHHGNAETWYRRSGAARSSSGSVAARHTHAIIGRCRGVPVAWYSVRCSR